MGLLLIIVDPEDAVKGKLRALGASMLLVASVTAGSLAVASPAQAATMLGGVNIQTHGCDVQYLGSVAHIEAFQYNVYGWRCVVDYGGTTEHLNVNLNAACNHQYGGGAWANWLDYNNPYSWRCYR